MERQSKWSAAMTALLTVVLLTSGVANAKGAAPTKCTDVPISVTIVPITGSVLAGDAKGPVYRNGVDGVNAHINICGSTPTYDANLGLNSTQSTRTIGLTVPAAVPGSNIAGPSPVWANGVPFQSASPVKVRNILWGRMNGVYTFTTRGLISVIIGPGDKYYYDLRMQPDQVDALDNPPPFSDTNLPQQTATVTVQDIAGTCRNTPGGTLDSWIVTVDPSYLGTLYKSGRSGTYVHSGQYVMPFQLKIDALSCVPASLTH